MEITASKSGGDYTPVPAGTYVARCYSMVHIGTVQELYMGQTKELNKVRITWELPTELKVFNPEKGEQPLAISREFTLSLAEKANLRKFLESWRGKGFSEEETKAFNILKLLGVPCMISIIHKTSKSGKVYAEISSVSSLPKGLMCPPAINKEFVFTYNPYDPTVFDQLPDFLKDKIRQSKEFKAVQNPHIAEMNSAANESEDDLPF